MELQTIAVKQGHLHKRIPYQWSRKVLAIAFWVHGMADTKTEEKNYLCQNFFTFHISPHLFCSVGTI